MPKGRTVKGIEKTNQVMSWIWEHYRQHPDNPYPPSLNEIAEAFGASKSVVSFWLAMLEKEGKISPRTPGVGHNIIPAEIAAAIRSAFLKE